MDGKSNQELEKQAGSVCKISEHLKWPIWCFCERWTAQCFICHEAVLQEIIEQARNNLWSWHSRRGVNPAGLHSGLRPTWPANVWALIHCLTNGKAAGSNCCSAELLRAGNHLCPSLTQYQAEKALLLRTRLRRLKLLKCEILLELLNNHTGDWPQLLGVHPQIHILPAFKQETFPWAQQAALC